MPRGGKRPGAGHKNGVPTGRPKGSQDKATISAREQKQLARQVILDYYMKHLPDMLLSQGEHARGVSYMRLRNPDGSFARATDEKQIDAAIAAGASWFQIFTEAPNTQAFVAISDRAIDKPTEHHELTGADDGPIVHQLQWKGE